MDDIITGRKLGEDFTSRIDQQVEEKIDEHLFPFVNIYDDFEEVIQVRRPDDY